MLHTWHTLCISLCPCLKNFCVVGQTTTTMGQTSTILGGLTHLYLTAYFCNNHNPIQYMNEVIFMYV